jgi:hypothetical protein
VINSADQIKVFRSVFQGREDAYGLETPEGPIAVREKLSDEIILNHLKGEKREGVRRWRRKSMILGNG